MDGKVYRTLPTGEKPLAVGYGSAFATDLVTVHGHPVGYMYRDTPDNPSDSGWRFLAGIESDEYMDDPHNMNVFNVNTIANYDPDIVPLLESATGSAFVRDDNAHFVPASPPFPVHDASNGTSGTYDRIELAPNWTMLLEDGFRRRRESEDTVLWAPGRTIWISLFEHEQTPAAMMKELRDMSVEHREATFVDPREDILRYAYLQPKADGTQRTWGLMSFCVDEGEYLVTAFYFDSRNQLEWALECWKSIRRDHG